MYVLFCSLYDCHIQRPAQAYSSQNKIHTRDFLSHIIIILHTS